MATITEPIRLLHQSGIKILVLTNAAGGIRSDLQAGDFMLLEDHINWMGFNPLIGLRQSAGNRFPDMTEVYDSQLRELALGLAESMKLNLHRGVYLATTGPSFETPAEIRAFASLGADAVGMSTVPEAIVARQCGAEGVGHLLHYQCGCWTCTAYLVASRRRRDRHSRSSTVQSFYV